jgi:hypothetical protein
MGNTIEQLVEINHHTVKWYKNWKYIAVGIITIIALLLGAMSFYQASHFNANSKINGVEVGGLTADKALDKLQKSTLKNDIYLGNQKILDGKSTQMGITQNDLSAVKKRLKNQWTFFPSFKTQDYSLNSSKKDSYRSEVLKKELEQKLNSMNQNLEAPVDAQVILEQGAITVSKSKVGKQYDVNSLLQEYEKHGNTSEIHLNPVLLLPIKENSKIVKKEETRLQELLQQSVDYTVQDKVYSLNASELIQNATVTKDLKVKIDPSNINNKITEINNSQSTLGKNFTFKTHSGADISVKGEGYGWALNVEKEIALVKEAFEKGEKSISASNINGNGWSGEGYGYETITNNGIGDTYAEVSIAEQRIWLYKEGQLVLTTNVVTGKHSTGEDTSPGVWYILFKRTPYTLKGSAVGKADYSVGVDYWAPFTNSGQGFHDAGWRTNWGSNAYLTAGSGGCINVSPSVMKTVYDTLSVYQPVVVY